MKVFTSILSFIILSMSVFPCADISTSCGDEMTLESKQSIDGEHHQHSHDKRNDCTPFCMCDCCSIPATICFVKPLQDNIVAQPSTVTFHYYATYNYTFSAILWQPPKQC